MRFLFPQALLVAVGLVAVPGAAHSHKEIYNFKPEAGGLLGGNYDLLPSLTNLSSMVLGGSFWASSYLQGTNGHQYLIVAHAVKLEGITMRYGAMDITAGGPYRQSAQTVSNYTLTVSPSGASNVSAAGSFFTVSDLADPLSGMRYSAAVPDMRFDITFGYSPVLLYGGFGQFVGAAGALVNEWASPAGRTTGYLVVNGTRVDVDPDRSMTWFDRQWGGAYARWHWYEILLDVDGGRTRVPLGVWNGLDPATGKWRAFATTREEPGVQVVSAVPNITVVPGRSYLSPYTNVTYDLDYVITFEDPSTVLKVSCVVEDQEIHSTPELKAAYEGLIDVSGTYKGKRVTGFGLIEITQFD
ncbi:hypothetical protein DFJ73DRAFT_965621 [Zopfochytrium polystomum]|nr:hypothetical protein DFJ73DRAFT_965621 [Zopfochytrium polystomum]